MRAWMLLTGLGEMLLMNGSDMMPFLSFLSQGTPQCTGLYGISLLQTATQGSRVVGKQML